MTTTDTRPATTAGTYTSTRSGLAAAAALVERLRDFPFVSVSVTPGPDGEPYVTADLETAAEAEAAATRLSLPECMDSDEGDQYREWDGGAWLGQARLWLRITHDQPAQSDAADRRDRRRRIQLVVRTVLAVAVMVVGGLPAGRAVVAAYGWLPIAMLLLALVLAPARGDLPRIASVIARIRRWTARYTGNDPIHGERFESYTAGTVRILGDECPVVEYRGQKTLGESTLTPPLPRLLQFLDALRCTRALDRGDTAPDMDEATGTGELLAALPNRAWVTVEWREPHPVYAEQRNVTVGFTYDHDERGGEAGRDVGGDWIAFDKVTAVICHSHAEVAS